MSTHKVTKHNPQSKSGLIMSPTSNSLWFASTTQGSSLQDKLCAPGGEHDEPPGTEVKCQDSWS